MNLFRSEEHVRRWDRFNGDSAAGIQPVAVWAQLFSAEFFRRRAEPDYFLLLLNDELEGWDAMLLALGLSGPYWGS
jgi:hypothetical protein